MDLLLTSLLVVLAFLAGWEVCFWMIKLGTKKEWDACLDSIAKTKALLKETTENNEESRAILENLKKTASKG